MDPFEENTHSFVVKIWLEEAGGDGEHPTWRGHITHVPSKHRRYVEDMSGIMDFIAAYLEKMGVKEGARWRGAKGWLSRRQA